MSVARHLHTTQPRTEVDVAADAIVAILDAHIVPRTASMIGRLSMATGVPVADIKRAWELKEACYGGLRPTRRPIADQPSEQQSAEQVSGSASAVKPVTPAAVAERPERSPSTNTTKKRQGGAAHRNS